MEDQIQDLLDAVPAGRSTGKYLEQLTDEGRQVLEEFETWLKTEDPNGRKSDSTARAYKGYVAKAIVELQADEDYELDTDVKSAIGALRRFKAATRDEVESDVAAVEPVGDAGT